MFQYEWKRNNLSLTQCTEFSNICCKEKIDSRYSLAFLKIIILPWHLLHTKFRRDKNCALSVWVTQRGFHYIFVVIKKPMVDSCKMWSECGNRCVNDTQNIIQECKAFRTAVFKHYFIAWYQQNVLTICSKMNFNWRCFVSVYIHCAGAVPSAVHCTLYRAKVFLSREERVKLYLFSDSLVFRSPETKNLFGARCLSPCFGHLATTTFII